MKQMKKIKNMLVYNLKTLVGFEILYKLAVTILFVPIFYSFFHQIVEITGYHYLTFENLFSFLQNPITILLILCLLIVVTFCTLLDLSTIIIVLDCSYQKQKISISEAVTLAIKKSFRVFQLPNLFLTFFLLFLIPFLNIGISSSIISTISVPEFIMDYITNNSFLSIIYSIFLIFLTFVLLRWLYLTHYFILEGKNFKEAKNSSIKLGKKSRIKDLLTFFLMQVGVGIFSLIFILIGILGIVVLSHFLGKVVFLGNLSITVVWLILFLFLFLMALLSTPVSYACISALYYYHKEKNHEKIVPISVNSKETKKNRKWFQTVVTVVAILVLIAGVMITDAFLNQKLTIQFEYDRMIEVTAHRGASAFYPENTMSAFLGAKELGAEWVELDVQQTKDKKLIVIHDTNFRRTTGLNQNTWEANYEDIKDLDAGSFFDSKYSTERIPLLEDVLKFAKDNQMKLNIELKPTGKETEFEKSVVDLIQKYHLESSCVITSQVYEVLEKVKEYAPNIHTVYVMSFAYGDIISLKDADSFSIEASSLTKTLVENIHAAGKEVYAWTVNTEESIRRVINFNVDNIITDEITLAKDTISSQKPKNFLQNYFQFLSNFLQSL